MWTNGFNNIFHSWAIYSYFTHAAAVDNFMLLSPQLARPANQCPLSDLRVHMSQSPLSINLAPADSSFFHRAAFKTLPVQCMQCLLQRAAAGICSLRWHVDLQWLHNALIMNWIICAVWLSQAIFKPLFIKPRFTEHSRFFSGKAELLAHKVSQLYTW